MEIWSEHGMQAKVFDRQHRLPRPNTWAMFRESPQKSVEDIERTRKCYRRTD